MSTKKRIVITEPMFIDGDLCERGDELELDASLAQRLISSGRAQPTLSKEEKAAAKAAAKNAAVKNDDVAE